MTLQSNQFWAVPFYITEWDEHSQHQARLKEICHELEDKKNKSGVAPDAKTGLYESDFDFCKIDDPSVKALTQFLQNSIFQAAYQANREFWPQGIKIGVDIAESWCHITHKHGHHDVHQHANHSWSAVYYMDAGDSSDNNDVGGKTRFYRPYDSAYSDPGTLWITGKTTVDFAPVSGRVLIFPSHIFHSQTPYLGDQDRYVVAINARIIKG